MVLAEIFVLPGVVIYLAAVILTLCVLLQTFTAVVTFYRYPRNLTVVLETLLELLVLGQILVCILLFTQAEEEFKTGVLELPRYIALRIILFAAIAAAAIVVTAYTRKAKSLPVIIAAALSLPVIEHLAGYGFVHLKLFMISFWFVRSIVLGISCYNENKSGLSALSVKNAIDSMTTGVMFCDNDGFILLANERMHQLMTAITGKAQRNGRHFISLLTLGEIKPGCRASWLEGQNICLLPDDSAWMFSMAELQIKRNSYIQLTATDITERWKLAIELPPHNEELSQRQKELGKAIDDLFLVSRERVTQTAKIRAHNMLDKRISALLHAICNDKEPDCDRLRSMAYTMIDEFRCAGSESSPRDELDMLRQALAAIGVAILIEGELPENADTAALFSDITKEAVSCTVRSGLVTKVSVSIDAQDGGFRLRITDNGPLLSWAAKGSSIKEKLRPFGGSLEIKPGALTVTVP